MTKLEHRAIDRILKDSQKPAITSVSYDTNFKRTEHYSTQEIDRMFASQDFPTGWHLCWQRLEGLLRFIQTAKPKDLKRYAGSG